jgi:hypothetical protein
MYIFHIILVDTHMIMYKFHSVESSIYNLRPRLIYVENLYKLKKYLGVKYKSLRFSGTCYLNMICLLEILKFSTLITYRISIY